MAATTTADALLREAHERGYRFPVTFDGFTAQIDWETPDGSGDGTVEVRLGEETPVETSELDDWANGQLRSLIAHRSPRPYEEGDGAIEKRVTDDDHALGSRIELDDAMESSYVVSNGQIAAVTRNAHGSRFTIIVQGREPAGDGTSVPTTFCVAFWDGDGALKASEAYTDTYTELDGVLVPASSDCRPRRQRRSERPPARPFRARRGRDRGTVVRARLLSATVALLALAVAGGASARTDAAPAPVEKAPVLPTRVQDVNGKTVVIRNVSRIVPLNGDIAETIFTLGLTSRVVGVDTSALYPKQTVDKLPKIGYQRTLSAEGILSLRPTVVIGSTEAGPPQVLEQIRAAGVTVLMIPEIVALNAGPRKLRLLGRALGVPKRGERLAKQVEGQIATAKREAATTTTRPRVAFLYVRGAPVQMIGGKNTRADTMIAAAGGRDAGSEIGIDGFRPITAESLVSAAPDVILVPTLGLQSVGGIDGLLRIPGVAQTPAGKNRRVIHYDDALLLGLGPRTGSALRQLVRGLHPELR